jgi:ABC-type dipeptide/oligopeptide/nickel transport system permease component
MLNFVRKNIKKCLIFCLIFTLIFFAINTKPLYIPVSPNETTIERSIKMLSSLNYQGKLSGSEGNKRLIVDMVELLKAAKLEPGGIGGSFEQPFDVIVPQLDTQPVFTLSSEEGQVRTAFYLFEDYSVITAFNGGAIDYQGEVVLLGDNLFRVDPLLIKDKVVVIEANRLQPDWIQYVIDRGGKGILCCSDTKLYEKEEAIEHQKTSQAFGKTGPAILLGYLSGAAYAQLKEYSLKDASDKNKSILGVVERVTIKVDVQFPIVETSNILGVMEGSKKNGRILLLSTNIDGLGYGYDATIFPGVIKETTGPAVLLELIKILSEQKVKPYDTIVFAFWNGQHQGMAGSQYYLTHPMFPLEKTTHIHLDALGLKSQEGVLLQSDSLISSILKDKVFSYAVDQELKVEKAGPINPVSSQFIDYNVPSVTLSDARIGSYPENTYFDTHDLVETSFLINALQVLQSYLAKENYTSPRFDYLTTVEKIITLLLIVGGLISLLIERWYQKYPFRRLLGVSAETLYFKFPVIILKKFYTQVVPYLFVIGMLSFLVHIKQSTDIARINGALTSNFSLYLTLKQTVIYLRSLFSFNNFQLANLESILEVIKKSSVLSIKLIGVSLSIAILAGLLRGIVESYRSKPLNLRSFGTLIVFSIPDVFIVLLGLIGYTYVYQKFPFIGDYPILKEFILPVVTLSIIPTIYITRITSIAVHEELGKEYVRGAKALGYSRIKLFSTELLPAIVFKLIDSLPTIMTLIFSNMIVVEYLFNYNGIGYFLLYLYKTQDSARFVPMAIVLGSIYVVFTWGIQRVGKAINPLRKET